MVLKWRRSLSIIAVIIAFFFVACGEEDPEENDPPSNQTPDGMCEDDSDCDEDTPHCYGQTCFATPETECEDNDECPSEVPFCVPAETGRICFNQCVTHNECDGATPLCQDGECVEDPDQEGECSDDQDCVGDNYCHEATCVSRDHICLLKNCGGQRGVCDPSAGVNGDCVNADACSSLLECVDGYRCLGNACVPEEDACAECDHIDHCVIDDPSSNDVECIDESVVCEPGLRECDGDTLLLCNEAGDTLQPVQCELGCNEETTECVAPQGESCTNPFDVESGDSIELSWGDFINKYEFEDENHECVTPANEPRTAGPDVTFGLELEPGEVGVVELVTAIDYAVLYLLDDCNEEISQCQQPDGHQVESIAGETVRSLWIENTGSETDTFYIVADTGPGSVGNTARADITISEQVCSPSEQVCSGGELGMCSTYGTHYSTDPERECTHGCLSEDPNDALCQPEDHSQCSDAVQYDGEQAESFSGEIIDFHTDQVLEANADCGSGASIGGGQSGTFEGPSAYFQVELEQSERLTATLSSQFEAGMWITTECDDTSSCQAAVNQSDELEQLEFTAGQDGVRATVVVQAVDADVPNGEFLLDLAIDQPLCDGHDVGDILGCIDDDFIHYCVDSDYPERHDCDGACDDGQCVDPTGSICIDTIPIADGETYENGSFASVNDDLRPQSCGGDSIVNPNGPDTIFEIEVEEDEQLISVDLDSPSGNAGFYLLDECPVGEENVSDQCIDSQFDAHDGMFYIPDAGTYFLVVDSSNRHDEAEFSVTVNLSPGACVPDSTRCAGGNVQRCMEFEDPALGIDYQIEQFCAIGCAEEADDHVCVGPDEEDLNNRCGPDDSFQISSPGKLIDNFDRFEQEENLGEDECFEDGTEGPDAFYEITLDPLEGFSVHATANIDGTGTNELGLYVADQCMTESGAICEAATSFGGSDTIEGSLEFFSADGGTYTLGLAGLTDFDSGEFTLEFEFFGGECNPNDTFTCDGDTAEQCTDLGDEILVDCAYGCHEGECLDKKGDFCSRPFDIEDDGDVDGDGVITFEHSANIGEFSDAYNPYDAQTQTSCTGYYGDGPDAVYFFDGWAGDEVELSLDSEFDGAIWLTTDCDDDAAQCVAGADDTFGAGEEALSHSVQFEATYFVIVDAVQSGAIGDYDFTASIDPGPRTGDPVMVVDDDDIVWELEVNESASTQLEIANDGESELEFEITEHDGGEIDELDIDPMSGTVPGDDSVDVDISVTCPSLQGTYPTTISITAGHPSHGSAEIDLVLECTPED